MKLPVNQIMREAQNIIKKNFFLLFKRVFFITILFIPIGYIFITLESYDTLYPLLLALIAYMGLSVLFAITIHRIVLLGDDSISPYGHFFWSQREWIFLGYIIFINLFLELFSSLIAWATGFFYMFFSSFMGFYSAWMMILNNKMYLFVAIVLLILFLFISIWGYRFSMIFPALAIGKKSVGLKWATKITKGNGFRLFWINSMPVLIGFLLFDVSTFFDRMERLLGEYVSLFLLLFTILLLTMYQIILISISFKYLEEGEE
jgi:hypothetical protein